jgi:hypothetical protein
MQIVIAAVLLGGKIADFCPQFFWTLLRWAVLLIKRKEPVPGGAGSLGIF